MSNANSSLTIRVGTSGVPQALAEIKGIAAEIKGFATSVAAAVGFGFSIEKIVGFTKAAIDSAEALGRLSKESGFTVSTLEAMRKQTTVAGLGFEDLQGSLVLFVAKMEDARQKGGAAMDVFRNLGQDVAVAVAQGKPAEQVYGMIAEKFHSGAVAGREAAAAHELFGKSFKEWIPILDEGISGLDRFRAMGGGITPEAVQNATDFNRSMRELKESVDEVFREVAAQLLPTLKLGADYLKGLTGDTKVMSGAAEGLADTFKGVVTVVVVGGAVFDDLGKYIGQGMAFAWENWAEIIRLVKLELSDLLGTIKDLITLSLDLAESFLEMKEVTAAALTGHFAAAREIITDNFTQIKQDMNNLGTSISKGLYDGLGGGMTFFQNYLSRLKLFTNTFVSDLSSQWRAIGAFLGGMWSPSQSKAVSSPNSATAIGAPGGSAPIAPAYVLPETRMKELEFLTQKLQLQAKIIQSSPYTSEVDKARQLLPILSQENDLLKQQMALQQSIVSDPTRTPEEKAKANLELVKLQGQQNDLLTEQQKLGGQFSIADEFSKTVTDIQNQWGTWATQLAGTFKSVWGSAISSISSGITGLIEGTKTWGQALQQIEVSFLQAIIQQIVEMGVRWVMTHIIMRGAMLVTHTLGSLLGWNQVTETNSQEAAKAPGLAANAASASVGSYGGSAIAGAIAAVAAIGLITAAALGAFDVGGYTGSGSKYDVAGVVHRGEYVMSAASVNRIGLPTLEALHSGDSSAIASGGSPQVHVHMWPDENGMVKFMRDNPDAQHVIADTMGRHIGRYLPRA